MEQAGGPALPFLRRREDHALVAERGAVGEPDPQPGGLAGVQGVSEGSEAGRGGLGAGAFAGGFLAFLGRPVFLADGGTPGYVMLICPRGGGRAGMIRP